MPAGPWDFRGMGGHLTSRNSQIFATRMQKIPSQHCKAASGLMLVSGTLLPRTSLKMLRWAAIISRHWYISIWATLLDSQPQKLLGRYLPDVKPCGLWLKYHSALDSDADIVVDAVPDLPKLLAHNTLCVYVSLGSSLSNQPDCSTPVRNDEKDRALQRFLKRTSDYQLHLNSGGWNGSLSEGSNPR